MTTAPNEPPESDHEHLNRRLHLLHHANRLTDPELRAAIDAELDAADRLHRQLVAARAEADGLAEAMRNAGRLYGQHLAEVRLVADAAEGAKKRAVELHRPVTLMGMVCCDECSTERQIGPRSTERIAFIPHPCRTIQALNGEA